MLQTMLQTKHIKNNFLNGKTTLLLCFLLFGLQVFASKNKQQEVNVFINQNKEITKVATINKNYNKKVKESKAKTKEVLSVVNIVLQARAYSSNFDNLNNESINLYLAALNQANKINDPGLLIYVNTEIGFFYYTYNEYLQAMPYFILTAQLLENTKEENLIQPADVYKKNAYFYGSLGEHKKSISYLKNALKFAPLNTSEYATILNNIGSSYYNIGNVNEAEKYFLKTKEVSNKINDKVRYAKALGDLALIYKDRANYQKAIDLLLEDIAISENENASRNTMYARILLSKVYVETKQFNEAKINLKLANDYVLKKGYLQSYGYEIAKVNLDIALQTKDQVLELEARRSLDFLGSEISSKDGQEAINLANWETQKSQFNRDIELEKSKLEKAKLVNWIVIGLLLFSIILVFFVIKSIKQKVKRDSYKLQNNILNLKVEQLESQNKLSFSQQTLKSYEDYLNNQNKQIELLESKLKKIKNNSLQKEGFIESIYELLDNQKLDDNNWLKLKNTFIKEENDYYNYLLKNFPDLSEIDLRILILSKMNLFPSEIATTLNINKDIVDETLQHLRIKYNGTFDEHSLN